MFDEFQVSTGRKTWQYNDKKIINGAKGLRNLFSQKLSRQFFMVKSRIYSAPESSTFSQFAHSKNFKKVTEKPIDRVYLKNAKYEHSIGCI